MENDVLMMAKIELERLFNKESFGPCVPIRSTCFHSAARLFPFRHVKSLILNEPDLPNY